MKWFFFLVAYSSIALCVSAATKEDPSVTVTGEACLRAPADRAYVILYTQEKDNKAESAISESQASVQKAMEAVKRKGGRKINHVVVNTGVERVQSGTQAEGSYEYIGAHCIRVSCSPEDEKIFVLIDDVAKGYASISPHKSVASSLPFSPIIYAVEEYAQAEDALETKALADAKVRAQKLAQKAGKNLGEILSIQTGLISAKGRGLDLPTPYISNNRTGVLMYQTVTVSYQLAP